MNEEKFIQLQNLKLYKEKDKMWQKFIEMQTSLLVSTIPNSCADRRQALNNSEFIMRRRGRERPLASRLGMDFFVKRKPRNRMVITENQKMQSRAMFAQEFIRSPGAHCVLTEQQMMHVYVSMNQQRKGPCSFAAYLTLWRLVRKSPDWLPRQDWLQVWDAMEPEGDRSEDIGSTLDMMIGYRTTNFGSPLEAFDALESVVYIPVKSIGLIEKGVHRLFGNRDRRPDPNDCMFLIGAFLEALLDRNIPVEINYREHSRVLIGYSQTSLLFADTQGDYIHDDQGQPDKDLCIAGYSRVQNKWQVYNEVRDLCFFGIGTPSDKKRKKKQPKHRNLKKRIRKLRLW